MTERDKQVLLSIDEMANDARNLGMSALPFMMLKDEFERIMKERDQAKGVICE